MASRAETTIGIHPEQDHNPPPDHLAIVIPPHTPWDTDTIQNAGQVVSTLRDVSSLLQIKRLTIYIDNADEGKKIQDAMPQLPEKMPNIAVSFQSPHERVLIIKAVKDMLEEHIDPDTLTEKSFEKYIPVEPDLVIIPGETHDSMTAHHGRFQVPGTVLSTSYAEFATIEADFLDMTPDDFLNKISEYQGRKRKFGALPAEDKEL